MTQEQGRLNVSTRGKGLYEITRDVCKWVGEQKIKSGLLTVFIQHTSASLVIQENADPDVRRDLAEFFERLVPEETPWFRHTFDKHAHNGLADRVQVRRVPLSSGATIGGLCASEGGDDMPSHIRAALTSAQLSIPVRDGQIALGTWQGIYVFEHRSEPQVRHILMHVLGE